MTVIDEHEKVIRILYRMGFISCHVFEQNDVYKDFLKTKDPLQTSVNCDLSLQQVYRIIKRFRQPLPLT